MAYSDLNAKKTGTKSRKAGIGTSVMILLFELALIGVIVFLIDGQFLLPKENLTGDGKADLLKSWLQEFPDGGETEVSIPAQLSDRNGWTVISTVITENITEGSWLSCRSSQQDVRIYIDGKLRTSYVADPDSLLGENNASAYLFCPLYLSDAGKEVQISTYSDSFYAGTMNPIYLGDKEAIWRVYISDAFLPMIMGMVLLSLALLALIVSFVLNYFYHWQVELLPLAGGMVIASVWILADGSCRQLIFSNVQAAGFCAFILISLVSFPFLVYMDRVQEYRYTRAYYPLEILDLATAFLFLVLHLTKTLTYMHTLPVMLVIIAMAIVCIYSTIMIDIWKGRAGKYNIIAAGFAAFLFLGAVEAINGIFAPLQYNSKLWLAIGLMILLISAAVRALADAMRMQKERQEALSLNNAKTAFMASMSHEIRTPLNSILGFNELIRRESSEERIRTYSEDIKQAGDILLTVVNDVLDFSKIETGNLELQEAPYNTGNLLENVIALHDPKAKSKKLELRLEMDPELPSGLKGDVGRIRQILVNLITNAIKYTNQGSVTVGAEGKADGSGKLLLKLYVRDTGIGIREEDREKLFISFNRLDQIQNRHIEGTGLGLVITKQLVTAMKGEIRVESTYGKGSTFTVLIPQEITDAVPIGKTGQEKSSSLVQGKSGKAASAARQVDPMDFRAPDARILLVDDNRMNLTIMKGLLRKTGVQTVAAGGGNQAVEYCRQQKFDLILMDHMMPDPDGIKTLKLIRSDAEGMNTSTKAVALTANALAGADQLYLKEGFEGYLSKPVHPEKLDAMIKKLLPESKLVRKEQKTQDGTKEG